MKTEAETGVMQPHAQEGWGLLGATSSWEEMGNFLSWCLQREHSPAETLILDF